MSDVIVIPFEYVTWMTPIDDSKGATYLVIGTVRGMYNTLAVTPKDGNGGTVFFCTTHKTAYPVKGGCEECRNAPRAEVITGDLLRLITPPARGENGEDDKSIG